MEVSTTGKGDAAPAAEAGWRRMVDKLLTSHGVTPAALLGSGAEAEVYGLDAGRVLRIGKAPPDHALRARRRAFYAGLDASRMSFQVPVLLAQDETDGVCWSIERRLPGQALSDLLPRMAGAARRRAFRAYVDTAANVRHLAPAESWYGEVLASPALRSTTWTAFVMSRARACLDASASRVAPHLGKPGEALDRLADCLARRDSGPPCLVHGDVYPANILAREDGAITALIDFGGLTLMGDPVLDLAGAVLYLTGMDDVSDDDRQVAASRARDLGLRDADLELCRLYLAFRFLDTPRDSLFRWCIETLRGG